MSATPAIVRHLQQHSVSWKATEKTRLLNGLLHLLDAKRDLRMLEYWREAHWLRLFRSAEIRKGRAYTPSVLRQIAQPKQHTQAFMEQLAQLVHRRVFRPGFILRCETCGLTYWYSLEEAAGEMACFGCRQPIAPDLEESLVYQPNPLLCKALNNGLITEILVLLWAQRQWGDFEYQANIVLHGDAGRAEIDLILYSANAHLLLVETKDDFSHSQPVARLQAQLQSMHHFAQQLEAKMAFATLYEGDYPAELETFLESEAVLHLLPAQLLA